MPEIIVTAGSEESSGPVVLRERVTADNIELDHYASQLIDRLRWAVNDATDGHGDEADTSELRAA
jgi:hypothetical protein